MVGQRGMTSKRRDSQWRKCMTVLHGGVCHSTLIPVCKICVTIEISHCWAVFWDSIYLSHWYPSKKIIDVDRYCVCVSNSIPLIPACTARPGLPLSPPEIAFLESPYYRPQTASIADRHHPTNFHSVTYTQNDDAAFEAGSDNDHKSFLRMRVIFKVEYPAELFRFRRVLDDILSSFDVF